MTRGRARRLVLVGQPGAEQQRVVGAERDRRRRPRTAAAAAPTSGRGRRPSATLETGQTSSVTPASTTRASSVGVLDRADAVADPVGVQVVQAASGRSPARTARRRAAQQQPGALGDLERRRERRRCSPRRSSLDSPNPTTPRPAYCAASRASVRASSGCRVRLAAITTATAIPVARDGVAAASSTRSVNAVMPPKCAAYPLGSTWISSQRDPSAASSSAASRTSRRTSSSVRSTDRATSYSRWNRNQPFSSAADSSGGQSLGQRVGQPDAVLVGQLDQRRRAASTR